MKNFPAADTVALSQHLFHPEGYIAVLGKEYSLGNGPKRRSFDLGYILRSLVYTDDGRPKFTSKSGTYDLLLWKPRTTELLCVQATGLTGTSTRCVKVSQNPFLKAWCSVPGFRFVVAGWHRWPQQYWNPERFGYRYNLREWNPATHQWTKSSGVLRIPEEGFKADDQLGLFEQPSC